MPTIDQQDAFGLLTKPHLLEIGAAFDLGLPGRLLKPELFDAIAAQGGTAAHSTSASVW